MLANNDVRALILSILSAMLVGVVPIATKEATKAINTETFTAYWSFLAFASASAFAMRKSGAHAFRTMGRSWPLVVIMGMLSTIAVLSFSIAVQISDPTVVAFFSRLEVVFTIFLGLLLFKEHFTRPEMLGALTTISGALVMVYGGNQIIVVALALSICNALANGIATLLAKVAVRNTEPDAMVAISRLTASLLALLYAMLFGLLMVPSLPTLLVMLVGAFLGPFLGFMLMYKALALAPVSRVAAIRTSFPFFVALYSLVLFGIAPTSNQLVGGAIIVAGILILLYGQQRKAKSKRDSAQQTQVASA